MRQLRLLAALAALSLAGGAVAKEKTPDAPKEKKICKSEADSISRIPARQVCRTKAEWAGLSDQEDVNDSAGRLRGISRSN